MKLLMAGGGTGGHLSPALSVGEALMALGHEVAFVGAPDRIEGREIPQLGYRFFPVKARAWSGRNFPWMIKSLLDARKVISQYQPDAVVCFGGFAAASTALAQGLRKGKLIIHEGNAVPGRTNLLLSRYSQAVCVTFENTVKCFHAQQVVCTGFPLRRQFLSLPSKADAFKQFSLNPKRRVLFVQGGSLGALALNELLFAVAPKLLDHGFQILHQTGISKADGVSDATRNHPNYRGFEYLSAQQMAAAYMCADLLLGRSGAGSCTEAAVTSTPAVLVPYPYAYANHQNENAVQLQYSGGAVLVEQKTLTPDSLYTLLSEMLYDIRRLEAMGVAIRQWSKPDACDRIVDVVKEVVA
ncbi:MAG: UDP-N-acetylglucosamine--N-acetylmuramyl-(pentapeptide) pyrophosphoryl-undecaprenol N-acetylglucosamine transferase [Armatimonadota bacterium]